MPAGLSDSPYAVVDCETTGLFPGYHHRVIELAVIQLDGLSHRSREWSTLIDPGRDLGDADIHGIRGRELRDAPTFPEVSGTVLELLAGRTVVAHNARFDSAFLEAELARAGHKVAPLPRLCTIALARTLGAVSWGAGLTDCCAAVGVEAHDRHQALGDARACADLFCALLERARANGVSSLDQVGWSAPPRGAEWPRGAGFAAPKPRSSSPPPTEPSYLANLIAARAASPPDGDNAELAAYLELLDRALEDRRLSEAECADLEVAAELYGLSGSELAGVHSRYLDALCETACADAVVTDRELYDLSLVAELLGLEDLDVRLKRFKDNGMSATPAMDSARADLAGKSVCFTGKLLCSLNGQRLTREQAQRLAAAAGLRVQKGVTRGLDLLVVADPETASGKARAAREYGTRIVAEASFWPMIDVRVE